MKNHLFLLELSQSSQSQGNSGWNMIKPRKQHGNLKAGGPFDSHSSKRNKQQAVIKRRDTEKWRTKGLSHNIEEIQSLLYKYIYIYISAPNIGWYGGFNTKTGQLDSAYGKAGSKFHEFLICHHTSSPATTAITHSPPTSHWPAMRQSQGANPKPRWFCAAAWDNWSENGKSAENSWWNLGCFEVSTICLRDNWGI